MLGDAVPKRIANFMVRKHELTANKGEHDWPENTLEHICPQRPKKGSWVTWRLEGLACMLCCALHMFVHTTAINALLPAGPKGQCAFHSR